MKKTRIGDIAKRSGVSLTTVSRYFNQPQLLSAQTREKIEAVIRELNYSQDNLARILAMGKSNLIGVVFPHLHLSFYAELLNQLIDQGNRKNYSVIVYTSRASAEDELALIKTLLSYRVKGLVVLSHMLSPGTLESFDVPVVSIERIGGNYRQINSDNFTGGKLAGEKLIRDGCGAFVHINNGYHEDWPSFKRILGFEFAVRERPYELIVEQGMTDPYSREAGAIMSRLVGKMRQKHAREKVGVFCSNDDLASLLQRECIKQGLAIPGRIEIIGYDNSPVSDSAVYPITSVAQNISLMAQLAIESLDNYIPHESVVPATLIEKETTGLMPLLPISVLPAE